MTKDWESQQEEIRKLYVLENKPLVEVKRIIEGKYGFIASERAYRDQFKKWGYRKNRTQDFPKPKKRAHPSAHSGRRPVPSLPDLEGFGMLQGGSSLPGSLPAFSAFDTSHNNLDFATSHLSSAADPGSQINGLGQDTQMPGFYQLDQNAQDNEGKTQLHRAVLDNDIERVRLLLNAGAAVDIHDHTGNTPLHSGVTSESIEIVRLILRFGPDVDAKNHQGCASLHLAISQPGVIDALVDNGADVSIQDEKGDTPLHLVLSTDSSRQPATISSTVNTLLKSGADPNKENNAEVTPFLQLLDRPYSESEVLSAICSFLEAGGSMHKSLPDGRTPLQIFLSRSNNQGFSNRGYTNRLENKILRCFIGKGASVLTPVSSGEPLILEYCQRVSSRWDLDMGLGKELFKKLTSDQAKRVGNSLLPLLAVNWSWQSKGGVDEIVQTLLHHGANPNHENLEGKTSLILLVEKALSGMGMEDTLVPLLEYGADPWHRDYSGGCALLRAAEKYSERCCRMMLAVDLRRRRSAHASETEQRDPTKIEAWGEWREAVLAAEWSESKTLMLRESEADSDEASKTVRNCALGVLAEHHIRLAKDKFQGEADATELRRKYVAGIMRDCRKRYITPDIACTDYLIELCLE